MTGEGHVLEGDLRTGARVGVLSDAACEPDEASAAMSEESVRSKVQDIFRSDLELDVDADTDVIDGGLLDSMVFVQLLVRLEEEFGVTMDVETLELDDFRSVASIARHVVGTR